ncbi:MAG: vanadium-dependent haloperoxidase [Pseudomonadota bacterium]
MAKENYAEHVKHAKHEQSNSVASAATDVDSRRQFLKFGAATGAAAASNLLFANAAVAQPPAGGGPRSNRGGGNADANRARAALQIRERAADQHYEETLALGQQPSNGDENRYEGESFYASYSKALPSNDFGEVDPSAFESLRVAMRSGSKEDLDSIPLDSTAGRNLTNPQGAFKFEMAGLDNHATRILPSWQFRSAELAGQLGEVYWQALARDVPFINYENNRMIAAAVRDLNGFSATPGARSNGPTTAANIFRGETPGDLIGPYISQFLWHDFSFGSQYIEQRFEVPLPFDFMIDEGNWLNIQRGGSPAETAFFESDRRYIFNNRSLGEYVHRDISFQAYLNAALILLGEGNDVLDPGNPYLSSPNQDGFATFGAPFILDMVTKAANLALTGAWFQKWRVHRFLRPEAMGGRIHFQLTGLRSYEIHDDILNSSAVARVYGGNGTYLLPQAFIEGSPTHPSFPAGHACMAGACVTILKAYFNEDYVLPETVQADATGSSLLPYTDTALTVGNELNKLANNIALGRDAAGVHYRQDGIEGLRAGEQQAISLLQDQSRTLNEDDFDGFSLKSFDGSQINIRNGEVALN